MSVGVLVTSHDAYADVWPVAAELFQRLWSDRQWPMYWMSNGHTVPGIAKAIVGPPIQRQRWGDNVASAVQRIPEDLILFWVEEIFPLSAIPNAMFLEAAEILNSLPDVGIVQLTRYYTQPDTPTIGNFTDYPCDVFGFSAALPAIFRKEVLLHLVRTLPDPRDFEVESASVMQRDLPNVRSLIPCKPMFKLCDNAVRQGPWCQCVVNHMVELGLKVDFSQRGISAELCKYMEGVPA